MGRLLLLVAVAQLLQVITADNIPVSHAANTFAAELYQKLSKSPGNVLVCPLSVHIALSLLQQGAAGTSRDELGKALHLTGSNDNIKSEYKTLLEGLQDDVLKIATNIYPDQSFTPMPEFVKVAQEYFQSGVQTLDYGGAPVEAAKTINKYVEDKTNNKIHDIVKADSLNELTRMIIINAVHFKAEWEKTFPPAFPLNFKVTPTESIKTDFFTLTDYFPYKEDGALGAKILKMDYKGGKYSMVFVLPTKDDGLPEVEAKLANISMDSLLSGLNDLRVEVTIPKFKIEKQMELIEPLMEMGITNIFGANADLSNLAKEEKLYVSKIVQKTFIDVNEKGTEAAAATGIVTPLSGASEEFTFFARRPFHYYLLHASKKVILFTGKLVRPAKSMPPNMLSESENIKPEEASQGDNVNRFMGNQDFFAPGVNTVNTPSFGNSQDQNSKTQHGQIDSPNMVNPGRYPASGSTQLIYGQDIGTSIQHGHQPSPTQNGANNPVNRFDFDEYPTSSHAFNSDRGGAAGNGYYQRPVQPQQQYQRRRLPFETNYNPRYQTYERRYQ